MKEKTLERVKEAKKLIEKGMKVKKATRKKEYLM